MRRAAAFRRSTASRIAATMRRPIGRAQLAGSPLAGQGRGQVNEPTDLPPSSERWARRRTAHAGSLPKQRGGWRGRLPLQSLGDFGALEQIFREMEAAVFGGRHLGRSIGPMGKVSTTAPCSSSTRVWMSGQDVGGLGIGFGWPGPRGLHPAAPRRSGAPGPAGSRAGCPGTGVRPRARRARRQSHAEKQNDQGTE